MEWCRATVNRFIAEIQKSPVLWKTTDSDYKNKSKEATDGCETAVEEEVEEAAKKIQAHFRGYKTRKEIGSMKASQDDNKGGNQNEPEVDEEMEKAATRIQASFRGHKVRKEMKGGIPEPPQESEEIIDIDLSDPDVVNAATKIQSTFRGYQARKKN